MHPEPPARLLSCPRCGLKGAWCLCEAIDAVDTPTRVVLVRHVKERHRASNSARWVLRALSNSELCDYGGRDQPFDPAPFHRPGTWLLFPGGPEQAIDPAEVKQLVVPDGTWHQCRHMVGRVPALHALPRLGPLPPGPDHERLRTPPQPGSLATIEAVARALQLLDQPLAAAHLDRVFQLLVERGRVASGRRVAGGPETGRQAGE